MEARYTSNPWTYLEVKKVKIIRPINAVTDNEPYARRAVGIFVTQGESESIFH